jgi:hypothetical protein
MFGRQCKLRYSQLNQLLGVCNLVFDAWAMPISYKNVPQPCRVKKLELAPEISFRVRKESSLDRFIKPFSQGHGLSLTLRPHRTLLGQTFPPQRDHPGPPPCATTSVVFSRHDNNNRAMPPRSAMSATKQASTASLRRHNSHHRHHDMPLRP